MKTSKGREPIADERIVRHIYSLLYSRLITKSQSYKLLYRIEDGDSFMWDNSIEAYDKYLLGLDFYTKWKTPCMWAHPTFREELHQGKKWRGVAGSGAKRKGRQV